MLTGILTGTPIWVWPLLVALIFLGIKATRQRSAPIWLIYSLPLLGILSARAVSALPASSFIWIYFGITYALGACLGFMFQRKVILSKTEHHVTLKGEWLTMVVLMTIFWMNFIGGVVRAVSPDTYTSPTFLMIFASVAGLAAGSFLGRALRGFVTPSTPEAAIA